MRLVQVVVLFVLVEDQDPPVSPRIHHPFPRLSRLRKSNVSLDRVALPDPPTKQTQNQSRSR